MNSNLEYVNCPACFVSKTKVWLNDGKSTKLVQCQLCGTVFASPRSSPEVRNSWLSTTFSLSNELEKLDLSRRSALERESEIIQKYKKSGKFLDIGCSTGSMFEYFNRPEWELYGVEVSSTAAKYAATKYSANVQFGTFSSSQFSKEYFDLVSMIDMLYYVDDPRSDFKKVRDIIRPDGLLGVEIAGQKYVLTRSRGIVCQLIERRWTRLQTDSSYLYWLTPLALEKILNQTGFKIVGWYVIGSPDREGFLGQLAEYYYRFMQRFASKYPLSITWAPKFLCLAIPC